jgi:hypothetical protein
VAVLVLQADPHAGAASIAGRATDAQDSAEDAGSSPAAA